MKSPPSENLATNEPPPSIVANAKQLGTLKILHDPIALAVCATLPGSPKTSKPVKVPSALKVTNKNELKGVPVSLPAITPVKEPARLGAVQVKAWGLGSTVIAISSKA